MNIAKGIKGIKTIKEQNLPNWHIFENGAYVKYSSDYFISIVKVMTAMGYKLTDVVGNALHFSETY